MGEGLSRQQSWAAINVPNWALNIHSLVQFMWLGAGTLHRRYVPMKVAVMFWRRANLESRLIKACCHRGEYEATHQRLLGSPEKHGNGVASLDTTPEGQSGPCTPVPTIYCPLSHRKGASDTTAVDAHSNEKQSLST